MRSPIVRSAAEMAANKAEIDSLVQSGAIKLYLKTSKAAVQILKLPNSAGITLKSAADVMKMNLKGSLPPGSRWSRKAEQISAGPAEEFKVDVSLRTPDGGTLLMSNTSYVLVIGDAIYVLSCVAPLDDDAALTTTFDRMVQSLKVGKPAAR